MARLKTFVPLVILIMCLSSSCRGNNVSYYLSAIEEDFSTDRKQTTDHAHLNHLSRYGVEAFRHYHLDKPFHSRSHPRGRLREMFPFNQHPKEVSLSLWKEESSLSGSSPFVDVSLPKNRKERDQGNTIQTPSTVGGSQRQSKSVNNDDQDGENKEEEVEETEGEEDVEEERNEIFEKEIINEPNSLSGGDNGNLLLPNEDSRRKNIVISQVILNADDLRAAEMPLCRSREKFFPPELFAKDSCALCYWYLHNRELFFIKWKIFQSPRFFSYNNQTYVYHISTLRDPLNHSLVVEASVKSEAVLTSFKGEEGLKKWSSCCQAAENCCKDMPKTPWPPGHCPSTWDGWQCWPSTSPNFEAKRNCPSYSYHGKASSCTKMATKQCGSDGRWFRRGSDALQREWSNYSSCSVAETMIRRQYVHIAVDCLSAAALLPALLIFFSYKQLRVHRITLHKHLFISLLLEAIGNISFRLIQLHKDELIQQNPAWCITLNLLTKYASLTNYMWYLCEGYYLHKLLASAFAEQHSLIIFYIIGWAFPLVLLSVYTGVRAVSDNNVRCWLVPINLDWIINLPPLLALLINIVFLVNIIRILVSKVRATNSNEPSQYRKAVRATMMVVPLFGLQYIVTIYRPQAHGCDWHDFYQIFNSVIEGSTGAVVAIIFCYTNGEVRSLLRRSWERFQEHRAPQGTYLGSQAAHSRSFSTVQTTFVDPSPARRASSVVSVCINSQIMRRSTSTCSTGQGLGLRTSVKNSNLTAVEGEHIQPILKSPRKPSNHGSGGSIPSSHGIASNSISKSPQLLEEVENTIGAYEDSSYAINQDQNSPQNHSNNLLSGKETECHPVVVFQNKSDESMVNIDGLCGHYRRVRTSLDPCQP